MADVDLFKVKVIDRYFSFLEKGLNLTKRRRMTYCAFKSVQPFWLHPHQRASKVKKSFFTRIIKKKKKDEPLYVPYVYLRPGKFFRNQFLPDCLGRWRNQTCQIFFQLVHSDVFGKRSNVAIFGVNHGWPLQLLYYRTTVMHISVYDHWSTFAVI